MLILVLGSSTAATSQIGKSQSAKVLMPRLAQLVARKRTRFGLRRATAPLPGSRQGDSGDEGACRARSGGVKLWLRRLMLVITEAYQRPRHTREPHKSILFDVFRTAIWPIIELHK